MELASPKLSPKSRWKEHENEPKAFSMATHFHDLCTESRHIWLLLRMIIEVFQFSLSCKFENLSTSFANGRQSTKECCFLRKRDLWCEIHDEAEIRANSDQRSTTKQLIMKFIRYYMQADRW